jgi:monofunctional biosynthetic peptidoglycan transglycosylase
MRKKAQVEVIFHKKNTPKGEENDNNKGSVTEISVAIEAIHGTHSVMMKWNIKATVWGLLGLMVNFQTTLGVDLNNDQPAMGKELSMDFQGATAAESWITVNDNVMGGRSIGGFRIENEKLVFSGRTNTNGGGFSSIRTKPLTTQLAGSGSFRIRCKGDGRTYRFSVRTRARYANIQVAYYANFETIKDKWIEATLPLESFFPSVRGMDFSKIAPALRPEDIESIGIMIYDKKDGPFKLEVDWIRSND